VTGSFGRSRREVELGLKLCTFEENPGMRTANDPSPAQTLYVRRSFFGTLVGPRRPRGVAMKTAATFQKFMEATMNTRYKTLIPASCV